MEWSDVGKIVAQAAPLLGTALGGPLGGAAGALVASLFGVEAEPDKVAEAVKADPQAMVRLRELEMQHERELRSMVIQAETARLAEINATMRAESASNDAYVRRMRPTWGYIAAATWAAQMGAVAWTVVEDPAAASAVIASMAQLTALWSVALSVLGLYVWKRSDDKKTAAGAKGGDGFTVLGRVIRGAVGKTNDPR